MPNISFEERQGASVIRRIIAGLWIVLALGAGVAYVNYVPRVYRSTLELCYNTGSKGEVLAQVESVFKKKGIAGVTIDNVDNERLIIASKAASIMLVNANLEMTKKNIVESIRADIESGFKTKKEEYDAGLAKLEEKLQLAKAESAEAKEYSSIINELEEGVKSRGDLPIGWEVMFEDNPRFRSILSELIDNISVIKVAEMDLSAEAAKMLVLSEWINASENQTVQIREKRVVHYNDSPDLIALKDKKAAIEASRMRLLIRATTKHPEVIRMSAEIEELEAQINALTRLPQVVEDVREITNPKISTVKNKIVAHRAVIAALNSKIETLINKTVMRLGDLRLVVADAQKDRVAGKQEALQADIEDYMKHPVRIRESIVLGYVRSGVVERLQAPNLLIIYAIAAFIGIVGAALMLYSTRKSSFKLEEVEATPEFPVLGKIGKIGGSTITQR